MTATTLPAPTVFEPWAQDYSELHYGDLLDIEQVIEERQPGYDPDIGVVDFKLIPPHEQFILLAIYREYDRRDRIQNRYYGL